MAAPSIPTWLARLYCGAEGAGGRLVASWMLAGGIAGGGVLVGSLALVGRVEPGLHVLLAPVLFLAGTAAGVAHAVGLAVAARPAGTPRLTVLGRCVLAAVIACPLLGLSWLVSSAITVGVAARVEFRWSWVALSVVGWLLALALCVWAAREGFWCMGRAYRRCPRRRLGLVLAAAAMAASSFVLAGHGARIPGIERSIDWRGAVALAVLLTVWVWVPLVYLLLHRVGGDPSVSERE